MQGKSLGYEVFPPRSRSRSRSRNPKNPRAWALRVMGTGTGTGTGWLARIAAGTAASALALDLLRQLHWGGRLAMLAIALGVACAVSIRRGRVFWIIAVLLLVVARWLRGSAGVPPDAPLVVMQLIAVLLMLWRAMRPSAPDARVTPDLLQ